MGSAQYGDSSLSVNVDNASSLEIGTAGGAAAGSVTIDAGSTLNVGPVDGEDSLDVNSTSFNDSGSINVGANDDLSVDATAVSLAGTITGTQGYLSIAAGGTLTDNATTTLSGGNEDLSAGTELIEDGTLTAATGAGVQFEAGTVMLNGSVSISQGTLTIYANQYEVGSGLEGSGQIQIGTDGQLDLSGSTAADATLGIGFTGSNAILQIASSDFNAGVFALPISGFSASDVLDVEGTITGASLSGDTLTLTDGAATAGSLTLNGNYSGESFLATNLGNGYTQISLLNSSTNTPPSLTAPSSLSAVAGVADPVTGISVSDATDGTFSVNLTDDRGNLSATLSGSGGSITGSGTHDLTMVGDLAQINADLATLTYTGSSAGDDSIAVSVNDGRGGVTDAGIEVTVQNSPPALAGAGNTVIYTQGSPGAVASAGITATDGEGSTLASASVAITSGFFTGDTLSAATSGTGITASYDSGTGVLTLTGSASVAAYQGVLDSVTYSSSSENPTDYGTDTSRGISWSVYDGTVDSNTVSSSVTVVGVDQAPVLAAGGTVTYNGGGVAAIADARLVVSDADSKTLASATVAITSGLYAGDTLAATTTGTNITATYNATTGVLTLTGTDTVANYEAVLDSVTYGSTTDTPSDKGTDNSRTITWTVSDGTLNSSPMTSSVNVIDQAVTYTLTTKSDTINGGTGNDIIMAPVSTLTSGDQINGGGGTNALDLIGGGTFSLATPKTLSNIQVLNVQEGQAASGSIASTVQTVTLRNGLNLSVEVAPATINGSNANKPTIVIHGANDSSVIYLATGNDSVYLGSSNETVIGGGGTNTFHETAATAGATLVGGSLTNTLDITGGGTVTMGNNQSNISTVNLGAPASGTTQPAWMFTANGDHGTVINGSGGNDTITVGDASQTVNTGNGNVTVNVDAATAGAEIKGGTGTAIVNITGGGDVALNSATNKVTVEMEQPGTLVLSAGTSVTAIGAGDDTIIAEAKGQILTGNGGNDLLVGYSGGDDTFKDTTANLNGTTIANFGDPGDTIDLTDLISGSATLSFTEAAGAQSGTLTVTDGTHTAAITLLGQYLAAGFSLSSNGSSGTDISYTPPVARTSTVLELAAPH
jgi:lipopolysaccharide export system protein LptA